MTNYFNLKYQDTLLTKNSTQRKAPIFQLSEQFCWKLAKSVYLCLSAIGTRQLQHHCHGDDLSIYYNT